VARALTQFPQSARVTWPLAGSDGSGPGHKRFDDGWRQQESVPIKSVDPKGSLFTIKANGGQIVRERWPHLRVEFENARFSEGRQPASWAFLQTSQQCTGSEDVFVIALSC
jgi:hypothetical protein